jgi:hypothetical protein
LALGMVLSAGNCPAAGTDRYNIAAAASIGPASLIFRRKLFWMGRLRRCVFAASARENVG